nr:MAG TPA: hypothetical protein [Caudoviricetes sp.]
MLISYSTDLSISQIVKKTTVKTAFNTRLIMRARINSVSILLFMALSFLTSV